MTNDVHSSFYSKCLFLHFAYFVELLQIEFYHKSFSINTYANNNLQCKVFKDVYLIWNKSNLSNEEDL